MRAAALTLALLVSLPALGAIPTITRDEIIDIAKSGVGCPYIWGGTCWNPSSKSWKGADCSGYVTKCWQIPAASKTTDCLPHYYTTSTFQNSTTHWTKISRSDLIKGDALVYNSGSAGHIVLYYSGDKWGSAQVYEAKGTAYGIVYGTKNVGSSYVARRRNSITAPAPTYPLMTIKSNLVTISGQSRDFCTAGSSSGIFDWLEGQSTEVTIDVKNSGTEGAANVKIGLWAEEPYLSVTKWNIYSDWKQSGSFVLNDTDGTQSIDHNNPGKSFTLNLGQVSIGETKRIKLQVKALKYSVGAADHPDIRAWVQNVDGYYTKSGFDAAPTNQSSYQTQNGGDLKTYQQTDVLAKEICDQIDNDCDGQTDEDNVCAQAAPDGGGPTGPGSGPDPDPDDGYLTEGADGGVNPGSLPPAANPSQGGGAGGLVGGCSMGGGNSGATPLALALALALLGDRLRRRRRRNR